MNFYLLASGAIAAFVTLLHIFGGGPQVAKPLLNSELEPVAKYLNYYCWHLVSISIAMMAAMLLWPALGSGSHDLAFVGASMALGYAIWGIVLPRIVGLSYSKMPQGWLFVPIALLGFVGVLN